MTRTFATSLVFTALATLFSVGCSTSDDVESDSSNISGASTCARMSEARPHYENAVRGAKNRLAGQTCEDDTYLQGIADEATAAVMVCPELKKTIKDDDGAKPIRDVLANSLTLDALTGDLLVLRDSEFQNWNGVEALLPGTLFSTEPQGAMGWYTAFKLEANGKATYVTTEELEQAPWVSHPESPATYVVKQTGDVRAPRKVVITYNGQTVEFDLRVITDATPTAAPVFQLVPPGQDPSERWKTFNSIVGECDA